MIITSDMVTASDLHEFYSDASDLGLAPGQWPHMIQTTMGNGLPFLLWSASKDYRIYRQSNGIIVLRVFND